MLQNEIEKVQLFQYFGIECDSDEEMNEDESDSEYFSDPGDQRSSIDYGIEEMFEIVKKHDFHHWSMSTIHQHYSKMSAGDAGKKQISRCFSILI